MDLHEIGAYVFFAFLDGFVFGSGGRVVFSDAKLDRPALPSRHLAVQSIEVAVVLQCLDGVFSPLQEFRKHFVDAAWGTSASVVGDERLGFNVSSPHAAEVEALPLQRLTNNGRGCAMRALFWSSLISRSVGGLIQMKSGCHDPLVL